MYMCVSHSQNPTKENRNKREGENEGKKEEEKKVREKKKRWWTRDLNLVRHDTMPTA